ncbi:hypothetical protein SDC9_25030 [bioreactor metagenome]|uniref:Uncharacterized protein n=1 Tax=bioreactor metagenome TaxID=1076179 RepID=A0A644UJJ5_9ZZZZ
MAAEVLGAQEHRLELPGGGVVKHAAGGDQMRFGRDVQRLARRLKIGQRVDLLPGEPGEFEWVRRGDVGHRQQPVAHYAGDGFWYIEAGTGVAHHRVADVAQARVRGLRLGHEIRHHLGHIQRADIAGEDIIRPLGQAAFARALQQVGEELGRQGTAAQGRVVRSVREDHGGDRRHLEACRLHREERRGIADMAEDHLALDRNDEREAFHAVPSSLALQSSTRRLSNLRTAYLRQPSARTSSAAMPSSSTRFIRST